MAVQKIKRVEDESLWARNTVSTLRAVRESFSDKSDAETNEYIEEELEFLLSDVGAQSGELRQKLLSALNLETNEFSFLFSAELADETTYLANEIATGDIVSQMEALWKKASLGERELVKQKLELVSTVEYQIDAQSLKKVELFERDFNLSQSDAEWCDYDLAYKQLCEALKIVEPGQFSVVELLELLAKSLGALSDIKAVMMNVWDSHVSREDKAEIGLSRLGPLEVQCVKKLEGEGSNQALEEIDLTKKLVLALVFALNKGAGEFGVHYNYKYSPENIQNAVLLENKAASSDKVRNIELKYWQKYASLAKNITADSVDEEFQKIFGKMIVNWMKKR